MDGRQHATPGTTATDDPSAETAPLAIGDRTVDARYHERHEVGPVGDRTHVVRQYRWIDEGLPVSVDALDVPRADLERMLTDVVFRPQQEFVAFQQDHGVEPVCA